MEKIEVWKIFPKGSNKTKKSCIGKTETIKIFTEKKLADHTKKREKQFYLGKVQDDLK